MKVLRNGKAVEMPEPPAVEVERVAKAIWEVTHPNPPGWSAWGDREGFGPNVQEREWTLKQASAAIEALPEPAPDPRDKTIAWLRAELRAALTRCRYGGYDRELGPIGCSLEATGQSCHCRVAAGIANESEATIDRLSAELEAAREDARDSLISEGMDKAADFIFSELSKALKLESFEPKDGTETWDGDVSATLYGILYQAGILDEDTGELANTIIKLETTAALASIRPLCCVGSCESWAPNDVVGTMCRMTRVVDAVLAKLSKGE